MAQLRAETFIDAARTAQDAERFSPSLYIVSRPAPAAALGGRHKEESTGILEMRVIAGKNAPSVTGDYRNAFIGVVRIEDAHPVRSNMQ